jgi:hypothetical protein
MNELANPTAGRWLRGSFLRGTVLSPQGSRSQVVSETTGQAGHVNQSAAPRTTPWRRTIIGEGKGTKGRLPSLWIYLPLENATNRVAGDSHLLTDRSLRNLLLGQLTHELNMMGLKTHPDSP